MPKFFNSKIQQNIINIFAPLASYLIAIGAGTWWFNNEFARGVIFLIASLVLTFDLGLRYCGPGRKVYWFWVFLLPFLLAVTSFVIGVILNR